MRNALVAAAVIASLQLVQAQDGKATLDAVAAALGAKSTLTSLQFSAKGSNHAYGQAWRADMPWPAFKIFSYTATIDYATPAMRIDLQRTNPDITPVRGGGGLPLLAPQAQSQAVSGKLAWNLATPANGGAPVATPAPATVADRQLLLWTLTPQGVIKAAMANNASVAARVISFKIGDTQVKASRQSRQPHHLGEDDGRRGRAGRYGHGDDVQRLRGVPRREVPHAHRAEAGRLPDPRSDGQRRAAPVQRGD